MWRLFNAAFNLWPNESSVISSPHFFDVMQRFDRIISVICQVGIINKIITENTPPADTPAEETPAEEAQA
jgi:hypothetical protein